MVPTKPQRWNEPRRPYFSILLKKDELWYSFTSLWTWTQCCQLFPVCDNTKRNVSEFTFTENSCLRFTGVLNCESQFTLDYQNFSYFSWNHAEIYKSFTLKITKIRIIIIHGINVSRKWWNTGSATFNCGFLDHSYRVVYGS